MNWHFLSRLLDNPTWHSASRRHSGVQPRFERLEHRQMFTVGVENLGLVHDTGSSSTDLVTNDPTIHGDIAGSLQYSGSVRVDFSRDASTILGAISQLTPGQSFTFDPRAFDAALANLNGTLTLYFRPAELDEEGNEVASWGWSNFSFFLGDDASAGDGSHDDGSGGDGSGGDGDDGSSGDEIMPTLVGVQVSVDYSGTVFTVSGSTTGAGDYSSSVVFGGSFQGYSTSVAVDGSFAFNVSYPGLQPGSSATAQIVTGSGHTSNTVSFQLVPGGDGGTGDGGSGGNGSGDGGSGGDGTGDGGSEGDGSGGGVTGGDGGGTGDGDSGDGGSGDGGAGDGNSGGGDTTPLALVAVNSSTDVSGTVFTVTGSTTGAANHSSTVVFGGSFTGYSTSVDSDGSFTFCISYPGLSAGAMASAQVMTDQGQTSNVVDFQLLAGGDNGSAGNSGSGGDGGGTGGDGESGGGDGSGNGGDTGGDTGGDGGGSGGGGPGGGDGSGGGDGDGGSNHGDTNRAPIIAEFDAARADDGTWHFWGAVDDEQPAGMVITFGDALVGYSAMVQADGSFALNVVVTAPDGSQFAVASADTTDANGVASNHAMCEIDLS